MSRKSLLVLPVLSITDSASALSLVALAAPLSTARSLDVEVCFP